MYILKHADSTSTRCREWGEDAIIECESCNLGPAQCSREDQMQFMANNLIKNLRISPIQLIAANTYVKPYLYLVRVVTKSAFI